MAVPAPLRQAYDAQHEAVREFLDRLPATAWPRPSRLPDWTVHDLAVHVTEVPAALAAALSRPRPTDRPLTVLDYVRQWREAADKISARDRNTAAGLTPDDVRKRHQAAQREMAAALDTVTGDPVIAARRGPIRLSDFLLTRVNELVVHSVDLSRSLPDIEAVRLEPAALGVACRLLTGLLGAAAPGRTVEVRVPPFAAVQCVTGPRHTRGTPPNVVETDPVTWVELATGRLSWQLAMSGGLVHASGDRADLSAYLPVLS